LKTAIATGATAPATAPRPARRSFAASLRSYVQIARPDHWIKNIFVIPGAAAALAVAPHDGAIALLPLVLAPLALAAVSVCLLASANYTINEFLDARYDRFHPLKSRSGAGGDGGGLQRAAVAQQGQGLSRRIV
jgi:4-hydroxybenzoate polyprenyltransferase